MYLTFGTACGREPSVRRGERGTAGAASELLRIGAAEERLRRRKVAILRAQLTEAREEVEALERELRALGDAEATRSAGRIDWNAIFARLGSNFSARQMSELSGARPRHVAAITHRWRKDGWVRATGQRGVFRKVKTVAG